MGSTEKIIEGLLFRVGKSATPDPTIFTIKSINDNEVVVSWQDIYGRGERTTNYSLNDAKSKLKFGDWVEVNPIKEITQLQNKIEFYREATDKCREFVSANKDVGYPTQPLWDAVYDKLKELQSSNEAKEKEMERLKNNLKEIIELKSNATSTQELFPLLQYITKLSNNM